MALAPGTHLGPYHIADQIGAGGMGEVYRAIDSNLNRSVAIKVLPELFATDVERLARFDREAKTLAALNHPNIAAIYGLEKSPSTGSGQAGTTAIVMELVDGPTLADRIVDGPIPVDQALDIARQISAALTAAHEKGIVHRDLKPANIKLQADGTVKVLDFGLAKFTEVSVAGTGAGLTASMSPTITTPAMTQAGVVLGTAAYMSPEQVKGHSVDKRADIWAFGVVLFESITGRRPFGGETVAETLASVIKDAPKIDSLPPRVRPLIEKCLEKDPAKRLRDIADAWVLWDASHDGSQSASPSLRAARLWQLVSVLLALGIGLSLWAPWRAQPASPLPVRFQIPLPQGRTVQNFAVSPDGRKLLMQIRTVEGVRIWVRSLDSLETRELAGTDGNGTPPFWSADSRWIAFGSVDGKLKKVDFNGGSPQTICDVCGTTVGGSWNDDGVILFANQGAVWKVSAAGGTPSPVVKAPAPAGREGFTIFPTFLPDGRHFVYVRYGPSGPGIFQGSLDVAPSAQNAVALVANTGTPSGSGAIGYASTPGSRLGRLLFLKGTTLVAQPLDEERLQLHGDPVTLAEDARFFWVARDVLLYATGDDTSRLTWVEEGRPGDTVGEPDHYTALALSPDARRAAIVRRGDSGPDLWLVDLRNGGKERLTFTGSIANTPPVWSQDGQSVVFSDFGRTNDRVFKKVIGADEPELLFTSTNPGYVTSISPDGRFLLHMIFDGKTRDVGLVALDGNVGSRKSIRLLATPFDEIDGKFSPDGQWVAYKSNESGRTEIYARRFIPGSASQAPSLGTRFHVSKGESISVTPGTGLFWKASIKPALTYLTVKGLMIAELTSDPLAPFAEPKLLYPLAVEGGVAGDMTSDGRRTLIAIPAVSGAASGITVALNWQSGLPK